MCAAANEFYEAFFLFSKIPQIKLRVGSEHNNAAVEASVAVVALNL